MQVFCHPSVQRIVLVMYFMHLIEEGISMEESVPAVKQHIFKVIDEQNMKRKLFEGGKSLKSEFDSLKIREIDDDRVKDELIDDEIFDQLRPYFYPVSSFPRPC